MWRDPLFVIGFILLVMVFLIVTDTITWNGF